MSMSKDEEQLLHQERVISLSNGDVLTLTFNDAFVDKVRKYCELEREEDVTDEHLKLFFAASLASI